MSTCVQQSAFNFETGEREIGFIHIYAYIEIPKDVIVYIGQSVDINERHIGHLSGDIEFDQALKNRPNDFKLVWIDKVQDVPSGPVVTARELDLIDHHGTWIELGIGYNRRVKQTWLQRAAEHFGGYGVTVDYLGGNGPFASVRKCRRFHKKGEHYNPYKHIAYQLHKTQAEAEMDLTNPCQPLSKRKTEFAVECDPTHHHIVHFDWDRETHSWNYRTVRSEIANDEEQIPF